jgi:hypothetical protein
MINHQHEYIERDVVVFINKERFPKNTQVNRQIYLQ